MSRHRQIAALLAAHFVLAGCSGDVEREVTGPDVAVGGVEAATTLGDTWVRKRWMLTPRSQAVAGTINGVIYVAGGLKEGHANSRTLDAYTASTNNWVARTPLPSARFGANGASVINGRLYVTGGYRGEWVDGTETKTLFVYDPMTNAWSKKADMPRTSSLGVQGVIGSRLYVYADAFGGSAPGFYRYNPATNGWVTLVPPPTRHWGGVGGVIGGKFYLAAGIRDGVVTTNMTLDIYDAKTGTWAKGAPMPPPAANNVSGAIVGGKLYVVGGAVVGSGLTASVRAYDPAANTWAVKAPIPTKRANATGAGAKGQLFIMGGESGSGNITGKVEAYTP